MTPSGEQDLSREGLSFFLAMVRNGDEKAVEVLMEEFDRLHRVIDTLQGDGHEQVVALFEANAALREQLATVRHELRERAKDCAEHCEDFTRAQLKLNAVTQERDALKVKP